MTRFCEQSGSFTNIRKEEKEGASIDFKSKVKEYKNFPKNGIGFKDISSILQYYYPQVIHSMSSIIEDTEFDYIVGIETRGLLLASGIAMYLETGVVPIRKAGHLPGITLKQVYSSEYGSGILEIKKPKYKESGDVVLVDDVLATGGTLTAAINLLKKSGFNIVDIVVLMNLTRFNDFKWNNKKIKSLIEF